MGIGCWDRDNGSTFYILSLSLQQTWSKQRLLHELDKRMRWRHDTIT